MNGEEVVLEFRFSRPDVFEGSDCREIGKRKLFPSVLGTEELVVVFKEHVESEHSSLSKR